ncbi:MAG: 3-oxoacyl-[acyl-carrier-protein] synthase III C-terminal domain-containing protein [Solirubrobacteraceae bacterium]
MTPIDARLRRPTTHTRERAWGRLGIKLGPRIAGLALADGPSVFSQEEVLDRLGLRGDEFAEGIFARCGVKHRHLNLSSDFLAMSLQARSAEVEQELLQRSIEAIDRLQADPGSIGTVLSSSLYGLGCPTLAHRLVEHYGMSPTTDKYHVVGVGCASAVPLLRLGAQALHQHPGRQVLLVAAESMSSILMPARDGDARAKTVGSAIFGDGCAAALLCDETSATGPTILASQVHQLPGTLDAVSLSLEPGDSYLHLARELPNLAAAPLADLVAEFLRHRHLDDGAIDHWIVHPGGRRIIEGVQQSLALSDDDLAVSWQALAEHGNVGTPSILYVLQSTIEERAPEAGERGLMVTVGPGVTVGLMLLQW